MSQCFAEDRDIVRTWPTAGFRIPKFPEEPTGSLGLRGRMKRAIKPKGASQTVISALRQQLETTTFRLLVTAHSSQQFEELRKELFTQFVELSSTISTLIPLPTGDPAEVVDRVFADLAARFEDDDFLLPRIPDGKQEAHFCLETLHRAHFLSQDVRAALERDALPAESLEAYAVAISQEWWSMLHLRCLTFAIRHKLSPADEVLICLMGGFRQSVMAYAYARKAIEPLSRRDYDSVDFSSLVSDDGDYTSDTAFGA